MEKYNRVLEKTADITHDLAYTYNTSFEEITKIVWESVYEIVGKVDRHFFNQ